jgi:RHS repeat-associated protein
LLTAERIEEKRFAYDEHASGGSVYNYYRDYDPDTGRYLQPDPTGLEGGLNPYLYGNANPLVYHDPLGGSPAHAARASYAVGEAVGAALNYTFTALTGTTIGVALYEALNPASSDADEQSRTIPWPERKRTGWTCTCRADCNDNIPGNCPEDPAKRFAFGTASADTYSKAKKEAKREATHALACQPKHIPCNCVGPNGERRH